MAASLPRKAVFTGSGNQDVHITFGGHCYLPSGLPTACAPHGLLGMRKQRVRRGPFLKAGLLGCSGPGAGWDWLGPVPAGALLL